MAFGCVPFGDDSDDPLEIYERILNDPVDFPRTSATAGKSKIIIEKLLDKTPSLRGNYETLKSHP